MPPTKRGRHQANHPGPALTWEDIDAAFDMLQGSAYSGVAFSIDTPEGIAVFEYLDSGAFEAMTTPDLVAWLLSVESQWGEVAALELAQHLGVENRADVSPELAAKIRSHLSQGHARVAAAKMIEEIGALIGEAADAMVADHYGLETLSGGISSRGVPKEVSPQQFVPVSDAPHMDPELVWNISRAYWHEIVFRGMELGRNEPFWITGIGEFSYDEVLGFTQHIWAAFKKVTGLDFTIPAESKLIKSWLGLSEKYPGREHAPDVHDDTLENKRERLTHYIEYGGPSLKLMEETGNIEPPPDDGFYAREYTTVGTPPGEGEQ